MTATSRDPRWATIRRLLYDRYNGVIPVTDEMVQGIIDGLAEGQELTR